MALAAAADGPLSIALHLSALAAHAGNGDSVSSLLCSDVVWRRLGGNLDEFVCGAVQKRGDKLSVRLLLLVDGCSSMFLGVLLLLTLRLLFLLRQSEAVVGIATIATVTVIIIIIIIIVVVVIVCRAGVDREFMRLLSL